MPGPYIKPFLKSLGLYGLNKMLSAYEDKTAIALCTIVFVIDKKSEPIIIEGYSYGSIVNPRGDNHFGWDPIFEPKEAGSRTFGEMSIQEKNKISHRAKACQDLSNYLFILEGK
jgi:inosine triphosphate pyrophosphatase